MATSKAATRRTHLSEPQRERAKSEVTGPHGPGAGHQAQRLERVRRNRQRPTQRPAQRTPCGQGVTSTAERHVRCCGTGLLLYGSWASCPRRCAAISGRHGLARGNEPRPRRAFASSSRSTRPLRRRTAEGSRSSDTTERASWASRRPCDGERRHKPSVPRRRGARAARLYQLRQPHGAEDDEQDEGRGAAKGGAPRRRHRFAHPSQPGI